MSEEEKRSAERPRIGGIGRQRQQYGTIGGGSLRQGGDAQAPERQDTQVSRSQDAQVLERSDVQTSKSKRNRQTVYLELDVDRWIRHRIADTREEISDVINEAVRRLMAAEG